MTSTRGGRRVIAVCGASRADEALARQAEALGEAIALAGCDLLCGGLGGVMDAACRGFARAREAAGGGGLAIGILPGADRAAANECCDVAIPTGLGFARNSIVALAADAVILCGGGSGTLSEAAFAWQYGKPVVALVPSGGWAADLAGRRIDDRREGAVLAAATPEEAVALAQAGIE